MGGEVECKYCGMKSRGERNIKRFLESNGISYKTQKTFSDCINPSSGQPLRFDFYLTELNICIEFDGVHHFPEDKHFGGNKPAWYSKMDFEGIKYRDRLRDEYCAKVGIEMIRIPYWEKDNINAILSKRLSKVTQCPC
jgi:very-short-patch-repair endonuclease